MTEDYGLSKADIEIILAYAKGRMRARQASKLSYYAEKTIKDHLVRIKAKTGVDPMEFDGLCELVNLYKRYMPDDER